MGCVLKTAPNTSPINFQIHRVAPVIKGACLHQKSSEKCISAHREKGLAIMQFLEYPANCRGPEFCLLFQKPLQNRDPTIL
jgi:hypothetical protein